MPEPTKPYPVATRQADSNGATACGAVAHMVGSKGNKSWEYFVKHAANTAMKAYYATFAQVVARIRPDSSDARAMAGAYLEIVGNIKDADDFFTKAGEESRNKFDNLFN